MDPKFLGQLAVWFEMRAETRQFMAGMDRMILFIPVVMLVLIGVSLLYRFEKNLRGAIVVAAIFGAFAPYALARQDLLIHRPAPAVKAIENDLAIKGWENHFKPQMRPLTNLLPLLDVLSALPIIFLFWYSNQQAFYYLDQNHWVWGGLWLTFLGGCGMFWLVLSRAGALMGKVT